MIYKITNFSKSEDKLIGFDARKVNFITLDKIESDEDSVSEYSIEELEELLSEFYLLLKNYPNALSQKTILKRYEQLKQYVQKNNASIANCYSYYDRRINYHLISTYGIRMIPDTTNLLDDADIQITKYGYFDNSSNFFKGRLNLSLDIYGDLHYNSLIMCDGISVDVLDREVLTYLKPNILTKHL